MKTLGIVLVVVALVLGSLGFLLDSAAPVDFFKIGDGNSLLLGVGTGPSLSTRVTAVMETDTSVTVTVRSIRAPLPSTGEQVTDVSVTLGRPLGDRTVIDASSGLAVLDCTPPVPPAQQPRCAEAVPA